MVSNERLNGFRYDLPILATGGCITQNAMQKYVLSQKATISKINEIAMCQFYGYAVYVRKRIV